MKRYCIKFVQLVLFFVVLVSGVAVGMDPISLCELQRTGKELSQLSEEKILLSQIPSEVKRLISNKVLRLVLDEVEDDSQQLMSRKKMNHVYGFVAKYFTGKAIEDYESVNNIDYIIKLIRAKTIGADPNTKSYKGNTVLHLLIVDALQIQYIGETDSELLTLQNKIALLAKYKIDFHAKNGSGNTIAHELIASYVKRGYSMGETELIEFLQTLGMTMSVVKNDAGYTAYNVGSKLKSNIFYDDISVQMKLGEFFIKDQVKVAMKESLLIFNEGFDKAIKQIIDLTEKINVTTDTLNAQLSEK